MTFGFPAGTSNGVVVLLSQKDLLKGADRGRLVQSTFSLFLSYILTRFGEDINGLKRSNLGQPFVTKETPSIGLTLSQDRDLCRLTPGWERDRVKLAAG